MQNLICPVCKNTLHTSNSGKSLACNQNHLFDFAKQGYINLLLSQNKKSKHPGDTPEMVSARTDFLNLGLYSNIATTLIESIKQTSKHPIKQYCDLACGEGYYTEILHRSLNKHCPELITTGIDISTPAIKSACKRSKSIQWIISSMKNTPLMDESQDLVTGLFFHFDLNEVERILKQDGLFIQVNAGPKHLIELRELLYDELKSKNNAEEDDITLSKDANRNLKFIKMTHLCKQVRIDSSKQIMNLLAMTPHYWRAKPEKKAQLSKLNELKTTLDIEFNIFKKER